MNENENIPKFDISNLIGNNDDTPKPTYDSVAQDVFEIYIAHRRAGFSRKQAFELTKLAIEAFL